MVKEDEFIISEKIAGRSYQIVIKRHDEASELMARNAAKLVRKGYMSYFNHFTKSLDERDLLAMTSIQLAMEVLSIKEKNDTTSFTKKIEQLTERLEKYLIIKE